MNKKAERYWCVKNPGGVILNNTSGLSKKDAIKKFILFRPKRSPDNWKSYDVLGYSCVECEQHEVGQHSDTVLLDQYEKAMKEGLISNLDQCKMVQAVWKYETLRQAITNIIDEAISKENQAPVIDETAGETNQKRIKETVRLAYKSNVVRLSLKGKRLKKQIKFNSSSKSITDVAHESNASRSFLKKNKLKKHKKIINLGSLHPDGVVVWKNAGKVSRPSLRREKLK